MAPNTGIQKAILLSRYVNLMKAWIVSEREGIAADPNLSQREQTSTPLTVSAENRQQFLVFLDAFEAQAELIGDETSARRLPCCRRSSTGSRAPSRRRERLLGGLAAKARPPAHCPVPSSCAS